MRPPIDDAAILAGKEWAKKHKKNLSLLQYFSWTQLIEIFFALRIFQQNENPPHVMLYFFSAILPAAYSLFTACSIDIKAINNAQQDTADSWLHRPQTYSSTEIILFLNDRALEKKIKSLLLPQMLTQCMLVLLQYLAWSPSHLYEQIYFALSGTFVFGFTYLRPPFPASIPTLRYQQGFRMILLMSEIFKIKNFSLIQLGISAASFAFLLLFVNEYRCARTSRQINEDRIFLTALENHERAVTLFFTPEAITERVRRSEEARRRNIINNLPIEGMRVNAITNLAPTPVAAPAA